MCRCVGVVAAAGVYEDGIPVRRVPSVLRALTGVELSQSAITQDALRRARGAVGDAYRRLRESVRGSHRNEEVREVVPADYAGVMVTDRARSYDARALSGVRQQKCLAHVLRSRPPSFIRENFSNRLDN